MKAGAFYNWMIINDYDTSTSRARTSNCVRISEFEGDLDLHFERDSCRGIINKLTYTKKDKDEKRPPKHSIAINGDVYNGTATLKQAVKLYVDFSNGKNRNTIQEMNTEKVKKVSSIISSRRSDEWPEWELPEESEILIFAKMSTKYYRFGCAT